MPQVDVEHPIRISLQGYRTRAVKVEGSATVYYGQSEAVSPTSNEGSLTNGQELTLEASTYFIAKALGSELRIVSGVEQSNYALETSVTELAPFYVAKYGAKGNGTNQTTAITAALKALEAAGGGRLIFGSGDYRFNNVTLGEITKVGVPIIIEGQGVKTSLRPFSGGAMLKILSGGATFPTGVVLRDFHFGFAEGEGETDLPYTEPMIEIVNEQNVCVFERITGKLTGSGTLIKMAGTYNCGLRNMSMIIGRYGVGVEWTESAAEAQQDTIVWDNVQIEGSYPVIFRYIKSGLHGVSFNGLKMVLESFSGDRGIQEEGLLNATAKAGETKVALKAGEGAKFKANDPVFLDYGDKAEVNKVVSVSTDTLNLLQPLRFEHAAGALRAQVLSHGVGLSITRAETVRFGSCQFEGYGTGCMVEEGIGWEIDSSESSCSILFRVMGGLQDFKLGAIFAFGTPNGGEAKKNTLVFIPSGNAGSPARFRFVGPFWIGSGGQALTYLEDAGNRLIGSEQWKTESGVPQQTRLTIAGQESKVDEEIKLAGAMTWQRTFGGSTTQAKGIGVWGHAAPGSQHAAIAEPAETLASLKTAVNSLREVLKEYGITA